MSKYIKLEDAIEAYNQAVTLLVESEMEEFDLGDFTECSFNTTQIKLIGRMIASLPTIEVSEDCISRKWLFDKAESEFNQLGEDYDINHMLRDIKNAPSVALLQDDVAMERLDFVKKAIETHIDDALCGIYFTRNFVGDRMVHLDRRFGIDIEICYEYEYFEIFGLTDYEQIIIESLYDRLKRIIEREDNE